jgi:hypothetical protein
MRAPLTSESTNDKLLGGGAWSSTGGAYLYESLNGCQFMNFPAVALGSKRGRRVARAAIHVLWVVCLCAVLDSGCSSADPSIGGNTGSGAATSADSGAAGGGGSGGTGGGGDGATGGGGKGASGGGGNAGDASPDGPLASYDRYEPIEIELKADNTYANPYLDVELTASVTPPGGSAEAPYTVPGFWDGGSTFRVRWAPRNAGTYTVTITSNQPNDAGLVASRQYTVGDAYSSWAPHGFVNVDEQAKYYFSTDDGTPFLWVGDTNWINLYDRAWGQPQFTGQMWQTLVEQRVAYGFSVLQAVVYNDSEHWEDGAYPFGGKQGDDHDAINPVSWQRLDKRVQYAVKNGLFVYLMTSSNGKHFQWPAAQRERLYRTIVARYAAYNVGFGGGEEVDRGGFGTDAKYKNMIDTLHAMDPYRRMVALHAGGIGVKLVPGAVDFLLIQYYTNQISYDESEGASRQYQKPFVNGETWYFDNGKSGMDDPVTIRRMAWRILLGGAAGYTYGHMGIAVSSGSSHPGKYDLADLTDGSAQEMKKLAEWFRQPGLEWWAWSRFDSLGSGRYLSGDPGKQYVIATETSAAAFTVDLSDATGTLTGTWFDIATGKPAGKVSVKAGPAVSIDPPGPWHVLRLDI